MADDTDQYGSWFDAALGGRLASYLWANRPSMSDIVQGYSPEESTTQKVLDYASVPARLAAQPLVQGGQAFQRWMAGDQGPETQQMLTAATMGLAGSTAVPVRPSGSVGVFGGVKAATANLEKLNLARAMEQAGHSAQQTWQSTGWFRDVDGNWKFEIPDTAARLNVSRNQYNPALGSMYGSGKTLGSVLEHPELYKAYPELAETSVRPTPAMSALSGLQGAVYKTGEIGLTGGKPETMLSTALHETQHKIQDIEGFAGGGTAAEFMPQVHDLPQAIQSLSERVDPFTRQLRDAGINTIILRDAIKGGARKTGILYEHEQQTIDKAVEMFGRDAVDQYAVQSRALEELRQKRQQALDHAFATYHKLAGEVEARNVERRHRTGEYTALPTETSGYTPEQQIVRTK